MLEVHIQKAKLKPNMTEMPNTSHVNLPPPPHCVAGVVQGGSVSYICTQVLTIVEQEQSKVLWIPGGAP